MSTKKTEHYGLHVWEPGDDFLREEFNENFAFLDKMLAEKFVAGVYIGDGTAVKKVELGFTPAAVLCVPEKSPMVNGSQVNGGLALEGAPVRGRENLPVVEIVEGGFCLYYEYSSSGTMGANSGVQHYIAFR